MVEPEPTETSVATRRERAIRLLGDVAVRANLADRLEEVVEPVLAAVCREWRWRAGHVYVPDGDTRPRRFRDSGIWWLDDPTQLAALVESTERVSLHDGDGLIGQVAASGQARWIADIARHPGYLRRRPATRVGLRSTFAVPILVQGEVEGVFEFWSAQRLDPDAELLDLMGKIGHQLGRVVERRDLRAEIARVADLEAQRIGRELHDGLGQFIAGAAMMAAHLHHSLGRRGQPEVEEATRLHTTLLEAQQELRSLIRGVPPATLSSYGLTAALRGLATTTSEIFGVMVQVEGDLPASLLSDETAGHVYRIAQEALHNAARHGQAGRVVVRLREDGRPLLEIVDDGAGFDQARAVGLGQGLRSMAIRGGLAGADVAVESTPGEGTRVAVTVPRLDA